MTHLAWLLALCLFWAPSAPAADETAAAEAKAVAHSGFPLAREWGERARAAAAEAEAGGRSGFPLAREWGKMAAATEEPPPIPAKAGIQKAKGEDEAATDEAAPSEPARQASLRRLGEAFRNFKPSEEITADNAVPFPADI